VASRSSTASTAACTSAAHTLGFADLADYLAARSQHDIDVAQLASELDMTVEVVGRLLDQAGLRRPRPAHSAHHRRATDQRLQARVVQLGFPGLDAYLADRVVGQAWSLAQVASELGINAKTVTDRLDRHGLRRSRQTPAQRDGSRRAAAHNRARVETRQAARLAELGFADLEAYLRVRRLQQGWPMRRLRAELRVDRAWLRQQMTQLHIP
jgi:AraC-like DNA-binding protein